MGGGDFFSGHDLGTTRLTWEVVYTNRTGLSSGLYHEEFEHGNFMSVFVVCLSVPLLTNKVYFISLQPDYFISMPHVICTVHTCM